MRLNVGQIMTMIASTVNQEASAPGSGSSEHELWLEFINRSIHEWDEANEWEDNRKTYFPSAITSGSSVALPQDFRRLASIPLFYDGSSTDGVQYPNVMPEQELLQASDAKYSLVEGNPYNGYYLRFNPASLHSGASVVVQYFAHATSVSGASDVPLVGDSQFIIDRTIAFIFEARSDPRFQMQEQKARERLLTMVENHNLNKYNSYAGANPVISTLNRSNFRIGRD